MRHALVLSLSAATAITAVLLLAGCSTQARVTTVAPFCSGRPKIEPAHRGSDVEVLRSAFSRVRTGTPMPRIEPTLATVEMATDEKVGAPILHVDAAALVMQGTPPTDLQTTISTLQTAQAALAAQAKQTNPTAPPMATTVDDELAKRIPWIRDESVSYVAMQSNQPAAQQAATQGLNLISLMVDKKSTLLATGGQSRNTFFGSDDHLKIHRSLQQFAGFEPFRLVTLLTAKRIVDYLKHQGSEPKETPELIALVAVFNASVFSATYFDEYFRAGQFVKVTVDQPTLEKDVIQQFNSKLKTPLSEAAEQQLRQAVDAVCADPPGRCTALSTLGGEGFTSIFGQDVRFAGVSIAFDGASPNAPWKPTVTAPAVGVFGPQVVQVLVEALFDANGPHPPGLMASTACTQKLFQNYDDPSKPQCIEASQIDPTWERINRVGNATQALVTAGVGTVIRGGNIVALNNESVANAVETLAGVTTRKAVQQVMWECKQPVSASVSAQGVMP